MNAKKMMMLVAAWVLMVSFAQAATVDRIIMSTAGSPGPDDDSLYKLDGDSLDVLATHAPGYFDTIANLAVLPNGNFGVIIKTPVSFARVWLLHTDEFNGLGSTHFAGIRSVANPSGGSDGGMSNPQGEFFLSKQRGASSDGARVNGLDDTLPVIDDISGGYFDIFIKGTSLSDGSWVLGGNRGDGLGSIEVRRRDLPGARLARLSGTDPIGAIDTNSLDNIGVGANGGANSRIYSFHITGSTLDGPSLLYTNEHVTDIESLSNGDWVVALFDDRFADGGRVVILHEDTGLNTLNQIGSKGGFGRIGALAIESDDDIIIGAPSPSDTLDTLWRYNSSLVFQTSLRGFDPITDLAVVQVAIPEPATLALLALGGVAICRRRRLQ